MVVEYGNELKKAIDEELKELLQKWETKSQSQQKLGEFNTRLRDNQRLNQRGEPVRGQNPLALMENNQMDGEEIRNRAR